MESHRAARSVGGSHPVRISSVHHDRCRPEVAVALHCHPLSSSHWVACSSPLLGGRQPLRCRSGLSVRRSSLERPPPWCPQGGLLPAHQEDKPLTGAVEYMRRLGLIRPFDPSWCPVTLSQRAARCWPSAGLRGGQLAVSSHVLWIVCGRLPLRGYRGLGPVRASVLLSRVLVEAGVTPAVHLHGPAPLATPHHHP